MAQSGYLKAALLASACALVLPAAAHAEQFDIASGDLKSALHSFSVQTGIQLIVLDDAVRGTHTAGAKGELTAEAALTHILAGTGFVARHEDSAIAVVHEEPQKRPTELAQASPMRVAAAAAVETVVVTSSKIKGDIQTVPIAITALSQEQLTSRQIAGGPDLVKEVPNLTFTKTNFTGYSIQIRGIGTQAISVTTDPAVAVAMNDIPFIRNHFFEQEFYDVQQVLVLRGPQGTLYGRNATAGVVNVVTAKPTDQFEAMLSADWGNYTNRRYEGMVNIPIVDDRLDLRVAGEWTKRDGYTTNQVTGQQVDGRDLWSSRVTLGIHPFSHVQAYLVWEHFQESDDRMRTSKQLCKYDPGLQSVDGIGLPTPQSTGGSIGFAFRLNQADLSQGCLPTSLYSKDAFEVPNGYSLPYYIAGTITGLISGNTDPYASINHEQPTNLRVIQTQINPRYIAKNDTLEFNADYNVAPALTFTSQTGYNNDFLWSTEDYNRFNTTADIFTVATNSSARKNTTIIPDGNYQCGGYNYTISTDPTCGGTGPGKATGYFCDPQLGCSSRLVAQDLSDERAWQLSQEFRLASNFKGPFNFSVGGNYMHYETVENYYVFANTLTMFAAQDSGGFSNGPWIPGVSDNHACLGTSPYSQPGYQYNTSGVVGVPTETCYYIDPNPLGHLNNEGHNYFLSQNPYVLNSYAGFGEAYYNIFTDFKLTGGIRWTDDEKHFIDIPSQLIAAGYGYASIGAVDQKWNQLTGRFAADWTPKLDFTDQTLIYGSFAHGYKAGGANPPGAVLGSYTAQDGVSGIPDHPLTFKPEFIDAYELGTKNTMLDGGLTLNGDVFFYNYTGYQISEIVDRTSINLNFNATVKGAELEASYEPIPGLNLHFAGGYEDTRIKNGQSAVDLMDRTAGTPGWVVMKPFVQQASNCIMPAYVVAALAQAYSGSGEGDDEAVGACGYAYFAHYDPVYSNAHSSSAEYDPNRVTTLPDGTLYYGYDPNSVDPNAPAGVNEGLGLPPNNGEGFSKNLGGNELPNAPHFTVSLSGDYTIPASEDWAATLHSDFYWQSQSYARVFNDRPYDKLRGYSNVNLALILTSASGWQVMGYLKNVFDTTAITGDFLNSDDSGLTTNVFLTDPRLFGVRVTKNW